MHRFTVSSGSDEPWILPHLGQRIVKTTVAVFLCLLFYYLRGYRGQDMPTEAAITAIICMQPYVRDTGKYAVDRFIGTLIGAFWGLLLLLLLNDFPVLGANMLILYAVMALGVLLSLYSAVLVRMPDASGLASIVFSVHRHRLSGYRGARCARRRTACSTSWWAPRWPSW